VPRIAVQGLFQNLSGSEAAQFGLPPSTGAVRTSLGLALQDNIPHLIYTEKDHGIYTVRPQIARWRFQVGVEYVYRNVVDQNESYGLYTRFRNLKEHSESRCRSAEPLTGRTTRHGIYYDNRLEVSPSEG